VARGGRGDRAGGDAADALPRARTRQRPRLQRGDRGSDVEEPLRRTVDTLLPLGEAAADVAELAALVAARCERLVHADAEAAALVAEGAVKALEALVRTNLSVTPGDGRLDRIARAREAAADAARRAGETT
jgi:hypothetical protein